MLFGETPTYLYKKVQALLVAPGLYHLTSEKDAWDDSGDYDYVFLLDVNDEERILLIAHLLDIGWKLQKKPDRMVYSCIVCAAPATMQCIHCNQVYCGEKCISVNELN